MTRIHLEGMGVVGSLLAWSLDEAGVSFTWHDIESDVNGWQACTGVVYPGGDTETAEGYRGWQAWRSNPPWPDALDEYVETCSYWYSHQSPPHDGDYTSQAEVEGLSMADPPCYNFNAQGFVPATRERFHDQRTDELPPESEYDTRVITHGFDQPRTERYTWGWMGVGTIDADQRMYQLAEHGRPCVYCKKGSYIIAYAYPKPGTDHHYLGTHIISQAQPKPLEIGDKPETWAKWFTSLSEGAVTPVSIEEYRQGWRPVSNSESFVKRVTDKDGAAVAVRPLRGSGVRLAPNAAAALHEALGLPPASAAPLQ